MYPKKLKKMILSEWLSADTRDEIAMTHGISTGMVSNVIEEYRLIEPDLDIMRELAIGLKKEGLVVKDFSSAVRLHRLSIVLDVPLESVEMLLEMVHQHCFKEQLDVPDFISLVIRHLRLIEENGVQLHEFEDCYIQKINAKRWYDNQAMEAKRNTEFEISLYQTTHDKLFLFDPLRPVHEKWLTEREESEKKDNKIEELERKNIQLMSELDKFRNQSNRQSIKKD